MNTITGNVRIANWTPQNLTSELEWELAKRDRLVAKQRCRWIRWKYYYVAILIVDRKSFIRLFARIDCKYGSF